MKFFWDTSAVINVESRLDKDEHVARMHGLFEFFSTMTGRGVMGKDANGQPVKIVFGQKDAAKWLRDFAGKVELVELDATESFDALDKAQSLGVQGPRIYDYAHAKAAVKAGADIVLTRNGKHFAGLTDGASVEWP